MTGHEFRESIVAHKAEFSSWFARGGVVSVLAASLTDE